MGTKPQRNATKKSQCIYSLAFRIYCLAYCITKNGEKLFQYDTERWFPNKIRLVIPTNVLTSGVSYPKCAFYWNPFQFVFTLQRRPNICKSHQFKYIPRKFPTPFGYMSTNKNWLKREWCRYTKGITEYLWSTWLSNGQNRHASNPS